MEKIGEFFSSELFHVYIYYTILLSLKMISMSLLTGLFRFKNGSFINPEDASMLNLKVKIDERVERVRRAHLNDLENIPVFFAISFGYMLTNPELGWFTLLLKTFTVARFIHSFVYAVVVIPQPARVSAWWVGFLTTTYMGIKVLSYFK